MGVGEGGVTEEALVCNKRSMSPGEGEGERVEECERGMEEGEREW
jgi:hypothetical protein